MYTKFHRSGFKKCGPTASKIAKKSHFLVLICPYGKILGSTEKVEYRCTTANHPLCNDTIIVLKRTPLHSVSVITNFDIPTRDKQKTKQTKLENNMHHLHAAMQYWQPLWATLTKFCVADGFLSLPFSKNRENFEFLVKISLKGQIPRAIFTKLRAGRVSKVPTFTPNFTIVTLKMWAYSPPPQIAGIGNFWYKFAQKGYTP